MNKRIRLQAAAVIILLAALFSCTKEMNNQPALSLSQQTDEQKLIKAGTFTTYTIAAGRHYCNNNSYPRFAAPALYFTVKFDSSAIYQSINPKNQYDENKLYGFADNNSHHQQFSARFGWRWLNGQLQLSAYTYNNGVSSDKVLGAISIGTENKCAIIVNGDHYDFVLNGITTSVPRASTTPQAQGYKLLPYFGGDEVAPHKITIKIREDKE